MSDPLTKDPPEFYRNLYRPEVERLARAICTEHGHMPDELVPESGYPGTSHSQMVDAAGRSNQFYCVLESSTAVENRMKLNTEGYVSCQWELSFG